MKVTPEEKLSMKENLMGLCGVLTEGHFAAAVYFRYTL